MLHRILLIGVTIFTLYACTFEVNRTGTWKNEKISPEKRSQIKALNEKLLEAFTRIDVAAIKSMVDPDMVEGSSDGFDDLVKSMSEVLKSTNYKILEEYHVRRSEVNERVRISSVAQGDSSFILSYTAANKETYVSLFLPDVEDYGKDPLMTVIYGRKGNEWFLYVLKIGAYRHIGKTAPELYEIARDLYSRKDIVDALGYLRLADLCLRPADEFISYQNEKEITDFHQQLFDEYLAKYKYPITLNTDSKPRVFSVGPKVTEDGLFPMVSYVTGVNFNDTTALRKEMEKMQKEIANLFIGIDKDKKYIFYQAFKEMPAPNQEGTFHEMVHALKE